MKYFSVLPVAVLLLFATGCSKYSRDMLIVNKLQSQPETDNEYVLNLSNWGEQGLYYAWLGHATVLIKIDGVFILTDPVLMDRIAPPELFGNLLGIKRRRDLPIEKETLPEIDIILISHAHYDHLDLPSLEWLAERQSSPPVIVLPRGVDKIAEEIEATKIYLDWDQNNLPSETRIGSIAISAFRIEHYGYVEWPGRDFYSGFNGYRLGNRNYQLIFIGDTSFKQYRDEHGKMKYNPPLDVSWGERIGSNGDLSVCILPVGDHFYYWNHMGPEQASKVASVLDCQSWLPVHYGTFLLTPPDKEPVKTEADLEKILKTISSDTSYQCLTTMGEVAFPKIGVSCHK